MFERPTLRDLVTRTLADVTSRLSPEELLRRSDARVYARVLAGASHELHGHVQWVAQQVIYDTAEAEILERWATLWGINRKAAVAASGSIAVTGYGAVPAGALYTRAGGVEFVVTESTAVPGNVPVRASLAGAAGNTAAGEALSLMTPIDGVATVATVNSLVNGSDIEDVASLRLRFLARIRKAPNGGDVDDYERWALEVPGVTRAWVAPLEQGAGTVVVRFVRDNDTPIIPDAGEVAVVKAYIEARKPVTAELFVVAPVAAPVDFQIALTPNTLAARAAVEAELRDLLVREAAPGKTLLLSHIREAVSTAAGEVDHVVVAPAANVVPPAGYMPTFGSIAWV